MEGSGKGSAQAGSESFEILSEEWRLWALLALADDGGGARLMMLPLDRRCRFTASCSVGLPRPLEGASSRVGGGSPAALIMELRPFAVTMPRAAAPVAVTAGPDADLRAFAARLLPLRLRFLITSVLSERGRVTPWSFCRGNVSISIFIYLPLALEKEEEHSRRTAHRHCTAAGLAGRVARAA